MVNQIVYDYLKENYGKHDLNSLKRKIIAGGYSEDEYNDALMSVKLQGYSPTKKGRLSFIWIVFFSAILLLIFLAYLILR